MSTNFGDVDLQHLTFPAIMLVDYIRVYQDPKHINIGCDPDDFPTQSYIKAYVSVLRRTVVWSSRFPQLP